MLTKYGLASLLSVAMLSISGCGGDGDGTDSEYLIAGTVLEGSYESVAKLNGYTVQNEIEVDPDGDFLGIASNVNKTNQPKTIYRIVKGGMTATPLYEFDLVDPSINIYEVSGHQINRGDSIRFEFSHVPSSLTRPTAITADKVSHYDRSLSDLIGYYESSTLSLRYRTASRLDIYATNYSTDSDKALSLTYTDSKNCRLEGAITKRSYQRKYANVKGRFSGLDCAYDGQYFDGLIGFDKDTNKPVIFGTTTNNSDAFVITANS